MKFKVENEDKIYSFIFEIDYDKYQNELSFIMDTIWQTIIIKHGQYITYTTNFMKHNDSTKVEVEIK
jgi:hypothetical protein